MSDAQTPREAALAVIGELPLTDQEWLTVMGLATMLRLGGINLPGIRALLSLRTDGGVA